MRIRIGHSTAFDFTNELYAPLRALALPEGVALSLPHEKDSTGDCTRTFFEEGCKVFVAEVSHPSTGLGMEIAYAAVYGVPVVCLHRRNCRPSSSLQRVASSFLAYDSPAELQQHIREIVAEMNR